MNMTPIRPMLLTAFALLLSACGGAAPAVVAPTAPPASAIETTIAMQVQGTIVVQQLQATIAAQQAAPPTAPATAQPSPPSAVIEATVAAQVQATMAAQQAQQAQQATMAVQQAQPSPTAAAPVAPPVKATRMPVPPAPSATPALSSGTITDADKAGVLQGTTSYMWGRPVDAFGLIIEGVDGDYARVTSLVDTAQSTILLKREQGSWNIIGATNEFTTDQLQQLNVPESLWQPAPDHDAQVQLVNDSVDYVKSNNDNGVRFFVTSDAREGTYARLWATAQDTDPLLLYMKQTGGTWSGIFIGSAIGPQELRDLSIPKRLWPTT